jgi:hypothetical protein
MSLDTQNAQNLKASEQGVHSPLTKKLLSENRLFGLLFVFLALQPILIVFSQPDSGLQPPRFQGFLITHDAPQSIGLLWTSNQSVAQTST